MVSGLLDVARRAAGESPAASPDRSRRDGPQPCGDGSFRIGRDGTWFYHGSPIRRKPLVKLFASVLRRGKGGRYWLVTPVERVPVLVEDAPFVAVAMAVSGTGRDRSLRFRTNLDREVTAGPDRPVRVVVDPVSGEPSPYVAVGCGLDALIARSVFYDLVDIAEEETGTGLLAVWSGGARFVLGSAV